MGYSDVTTVTASIVLQLKRFFGMSRNFNSKVDESRETFSPGQSSIRVRPNLGLDKFETEKNPAVAAAGHMTRTFFRRLVQKLWCRGESTRTDIACQLRSKQPRGSILS